MHIEYYLISAARRAHRLRPGRSYVMGREEGVDIHLQDAMISRRHCELRYDDSGHWILVDQGSSNGTTINAQRVQGMNLLQDSDRIQLGGQVFTYRMVPPGCDLAALSNEAPEIANDVTMAPGMMPAQMMSAGAAFSGKIDNGLLDLLQFFVLTRKTGRLDVVKGGPIGSVYFNVGQIIHALGQGAQGFDGLLNISRADAQSFAFHADQLPQGAPSITNSSDGTLMELARLQDEG